MSMYLMRRKRELNPQGCYARPASNGVPSPVGLFLQCHCTSSMEIPRIVGSGRLLLPVVVLTNAKFIVGVGPDGFTYLFPDWLEAVRAEVHLHPIVDALLNVAIDLQDVSEVAFLGLWIEDYLALVTVPYPFALVFPSSRYFDPLLN
jgi:hypothetical protein